MMISSFSVDTITEEAGTVIKVLKTSHGMSQVRISFKSKGIETYALATVSVTNGQLVKVFGVTAQYYPDAFGDKPSFTRIALPTN